jgi:hypothetical protein
MRTAYARPELEAHLIDATRRILGLPADKVFIGDFASDTAAPERPFVSIIVAPESSPSRTGTVRYQPGIEYWRCEIIDDVDGNYSIEVDGTTFTHAAVGQTKAQIRDALVALLGGPNYTAAAAGSVSIDIESEVLLRRLLVSSSANITSEKLRGNTIKITTRTQSLAVQARCVGSYSATPSATNSGVDMAERLLVGLYDADTTRAMRDDGFAINSGVVADLSTITDGFAELIGSLDATCVTNSIYVETIDNATSASVRFEE